MTLPKHIAFTAARLIEQMDTLQESIEQVGDCYRRTVAAASKLSQEVSAEFGAEIAFDLETEIASETEFCRRQGYPKRDSFEASIAAPRQNLVERLQDALKHLDSMQPMAQAEPAREFGPGCARVLCKPLGVGAAMPWNPAASEETSILTGSPDISPLAD